MKRLMKWVGLCLCVTLMPGTAMGVTTWFQGFETDTTGWFGSVTRVSSGTGGITSSDGSYHGVVTGSGPFSRFEGYSDTWPGGWTASVDIFLDTSWGANTGFEYTVASNGSSGSHLRDFVFHVTQDSSTGKILVAADNNAYGSARTDIETAYSNYYGVTASGWYTFQHVFSETAGTLSVALKLLDAGGNVLFTETRNDGSDTIPGVVGGNRYSWMVTNTISGGVAIDNHMKTEVPEPATMALIGSGVAAMAARRKRLI